MKINWANVLLFLTMILLIVLIVKQFKTDSFSNVEHSSQDPCNTLSYSDCVHNSGHCKYNDVVKQCQSNTDLKPQVRNALQIQTLTTPPSIQLIQQQFPEQFKQFQTSLQDPTNPKNKQTLTTLIGQVKSAGPNIQQTFKSYVNTLPSNQQQIINPLITF